MSRRIARSRLFTLNEFGQDVSPITTGAGSLSAVGSQTQTREGSLITTDFQIDFGNAASPMSSSQSPSSGTSATGTKVINNGSVNGGQILQLSNTVHGIVAELELICVEAPTGGEDNIGVWRGDNISGSGASMNFGTGTELIAAANQTVGLIGNDLPDANLAGKYIYLVSSGSTGEFYTAGKFILRVYGYPVFDDV